MLEKMYSIVCTGCGQSSHQGQPQGLCPQQWEIKDGREQDAGFAVTSRVVADKSGREYGEDWDYRDMRDVLRAGKSLSAGTVHWFGMERRGQDLPFPSTPGRQLVLALPF